MSLFQLQRIASIAVLVLLALFSNHSVQSFTITSSSLSLQQQQQQQLSRRSFTATRLYDEPPVRNVERGVSVDQDGKSNVWAIEPKIEIEQKSNEDKSTAALFAVGGLVVCGAAAALILTNLPDPNQF